MEGAGTCLEQEHTSQLRHKRHPQLEQQNRHTRRFRQVELFAGLMRPAVPLMGEGIEAPCTAQIPRPSHPSLSAPSQPTRTSTMSFPLRALHPLYHLFPILFQPPLSAYQPPGPHTRAPPCIPGIASVLGLGNLTLISDWLHDIGVIVSSANSITVI